MFMKVHRVAGAGDIVAVCDSELMNRTLVEGELRIEITHRFFGDSDVGEEEVKEAMMTAATINLFGEKAMALARSLDLVDEGSFILIGGIPHAQVFRL